MAQAKPTVYEFIPSSANCATRFCSATSGSIRPEQAGSSLVTVAVLAALTVPTRCGAICSGRSTTG